MRMGVLQKVSFIIVHSRTFINFFLNRAARHAVVLSISQGDRAPFFVLLRRTPSASNLPVRASPDVWRRDSSGADEKGGFADGFEQEFGFEQDGAARARGEESSGGRAESRTVELPDGRDVQLFETPLDL